jgi:hypothetical protein
LASTTKYMTDPLIEYIFYDPAIRTIINSFLIMKFPYKLREQIIYLLVDIWYYNANISKNNQYDIIIQRLSIYLTNESLWKLPLNINNICNIIVKEFFKNSIIKTRLKITKYNWKDMNYVNLKLITNMTMYLKNNMSNFHILFNIHDYMVLIKLLFISNEKELAKIVKNKLLKIVIDFYTDIIHPDMSHEYYKMLDYI